MRELLNPRPDRPLPRHDELRAELLEALEDEQSRPKRRALVPIAAAVAVLAVGGGLAVAVPALRDADAPAAGQERVRQLTAAETAKLQQECLAEADEITVKQLPKPFRGYQPIRAFQFTDILDPKVVDTWLIAEGKVDEWQDDTQPPASDVLTPKTGFWLCSRTAGGKISESSLRSQQQYLGGDPMRSVARNAGIFAGPVDRVTVEVPGKPAIEAYLTDGFYFAPTEGRVDWGRYDADDPKANAYVIRGYANGKQIYLSTKPRSDCWVKLPETPGFKQPTPIRGSVTQCKEVYSWPS
ncbi:hypothetical protein HPO96_13750 [Kribbella sandramycini]|uniref:Uncharacterized protein n=1 Tax=Kribbella sandramycini TaxID=60450 RepID=A0A7Y4NYT8_9ACTN|nr:hypothetical protein [Kribbella sandramycini]MBB6565040.1 hypothetical protein [Kribbella sandramycini]NOL41312.1 hypothetical protein [Kribbella sandramycini]